MKNFLRRSLSTSLAVLLPLVGGGAIIVVGNAASTTPSGASTIPPWEPDPSSVGGLVFYDSSGNVITGGSITSAPIAAYVAGTSSLRAGDTKATLYGYLPVNGEAPGQWSGEALGASTTFPATSAPSPVAGLSVPVETGGVTDLSIADLESDYPNNDTSSDGYAGVYVLRLKSSQKGLANTTTYDSADIVVSGSTWSVEYTATPQVATTTSLSTDPASSAAYGSSVTLTATVTPSDAVGSVNFYDGATLLGNEALANGSAQLATSALSGGTQSLTAAFVATDASAFSDSTSSAESFGVTALSTSTSLAAPPSSLTYGTKATLTSKVSPGAASGTVKFYDGSTVLGSASVSSGVASIKTTALSGGLNALKAVFSPSNHDYSSSSSSVIRFTLKAASTKIALKASSAIVVKGKALTLTASLSPSSAAGVVTFYNGSKKISSLKVAKGRAVLVTKALSVSAHLIKAVFTPSKVADFKSSTSSSVKVTVKK